MRQKPSAVADGVVTKRLQAVTPMKLSFTFVEVTTRLRASRTLVSPSAEGALRQFTGLVRPSCRTPLTRFFGYEGFRSSSLALPINLITFG